METVTRRAGLKRVVEAEKWRCSLSRETARASLARETEREREISRRETERERDISAERKEDEVHFQMYKK